MATKKKNQNNVDQQLYYIARDEVKECIDAFEGTNNPTLQQLLEFQSRFTTSFETFNKQMQDVKSVLTIEELRGDMTYYPRTVHRLQAQIDSCIQILRAQPMTASAPRPDPVADTRLPRLELPTFNGNLGEWMSFIDQFDAVVHNRSIPPVQKLVYLKSCLKGSAARVIQNIATTDDNYDVARAAVIADYHSGRHIIRSILTKVIDAKPVKDENAAHLRGLYMTFNEAVMQMENLNRDVNNDMWHHLLLSKLDADTQKAWELDNPGND